MDRTPKALSHRRSTPFIDRDDVEAGLVADDELVVPGRERAVAFQAVDVALRSVALLAVLGVEVGGLPPFDLFFAGSRPGRLSFNHFDGAVVTCCRLVQGWW
ncbi:hypothetical protein AB0C01_13985 [Micromonospora sp. NPDC048905]|uniref:hypothetical protein n=1 Tax=unclassified Micromonospora TaxID=2617518 RepID=UPI0033CA66F5